MQFGTAFPMIALKDPAEVKDFAQTAEGAGMDYVTFSGHFLSTQPGRYPDRPQPLYAGPYHEPLVTFAYLTGLTTRLQFLTSVLILPLFPTALIAKQAAELSILSGGRLRLGVAISWNPLEYQAMGQDIHTRGRRIEEQITLLRRLWTEPFVTFQGEFHQLEDVGLYRLPDRPIPIWMGSGTDDKVLRRVARLADGWLPNVDPAEPVQRLKGYLAEEGRDASAFGFGGRLSAANDNPDEWITAARRLQDIGVTHVSISGPPDVPALTALERVAKARKVVADALAT